MVSIHKVPVIVYLIIRVICFAFRFKRGEPTCCLFHSLRLLHCLSKSNRQRQSPRRYENPRREVYIHKHALRPNGYNGGLQ